MDAIVNNKQNRAPILEALQSYKGTVRFHMPGHRGGKGTDPISLSTLGVKAFENDVTGVPAMDDLQEPKKCIAEAQQLAAELFGADQTLFVVNGTSGAILTMVLASLNDQDSIIIPRNIHKSILSAIILSGAKPVFVLPFYDHHLGFALGVEESSLVQCLKENPDAQKAKAVLLVNPTYYGTSQDLTAIASLLHEQKKILLVDEAHGPHFHFHEALPRPALKTGADAVAQGAHKIIGALTQASFLHIKGSNIDGPRLKASFQYLTSTSPSYLLLASLDGARRQMAINGSDLLDRAINLAEWLRGEINRIPGLYCFGKEIAQKPGVDAIDPTKLTITVKELGITGYQAEKYLWQTKRLQVEMSDLYNILIIVSYGNDMADALTLINGLKELIKAVHDGEIPKKLKIPQDSVPKLPPAPKMALIPRKAAQAPWERVPLKDSIGRISSEVITCYPPGIPILYPGEVISTEVTDYLQIMRLLAFGISGPEDRTLATIRVVKQM